MSRYVITCTVDDTRLDLLARLRAEHYAFLAAHRRTILFGGPARASEGAGPKR